jgi:hypothetical protein
MPKVYIKYKNKAEEYEINASGWFFGAIAFTNNPRSQIKKIIKEYEIPNNEKLENQR